MSDDPVDEGFTIPEHNLTVDGRNRYSLGHALRVDISVPLRASRRLVKHAGLADVSADELTEKIVQSLLGTFEIRWKGGTPTDEETRRPDGW